MRAKRVDVTQPAIVKAMRDAGAYVWVIGLPLDLLVGHAGKTAIVECKSTEKSRYTQLQLDFIRDWKGGTYARIDNVESALTLLKVMEAA